MLNDLATSKVGKGYRWLCFHSVIASSDKTRPSSSEEILDSFQGRVPGRPHIGHILFMAA